MVQTLMKDLWTGIAVVLLISLVVHPLTMQQVSHVPVFSGTDAYDYLVEQCDFGPRPPGSENLSLCRVMITETFESFGWNVTFQNFTYKEVECTNIIVRWSSSTNTSTILGAHYDTRPPGPSDPGSGLGANDGASGVAVLMELAQILPEEIRPSIEIVLFDAEDSGGISGWDWIQGSTYYVSQLTEERRSSIQAMVLLDMVGDINLVLPRESSSTRSLQNSIWDVADQLGYSDTFIDTYDGPIIDDHRPFLNADIPAVDIIQIPFPSTWHTLDDTPEMCSAESLEIVGEVLEVFLVEAADNTTGYPSDPSIIPLIGVILIVVLALPLIYILLKRK